MASAKSSKNISDPNSGEYKSPTLLQPLHLKVLMLNQRLAESIIENFSCIQVLVESVLEADMGSTGTRPSTSQSKQLLN